MTSAVWARSNSYNFTTRTANPILEQALTQLTSLPEVSRVRQVLNEATTLSDRNTLTGG
jgi:hypothetical protein